MNLYAVLGKSHGMDARHLVNDGNRKSKAQNGLLNYLNLQTWRE